MGLTTEHGGRGPTVVVPGTGQFLKGKLELARLSLINIHV